MEKTTLIQNWLLKKDFDEGVEILMNFREPMARILKKRGPRHLSKLEYELRKIGQIKKVAPKITLAKKAPPTAQKPKVGAQAAPPTPGQPHKPSPQKQPAKTAAPPVVKVVTKPATKPAKVAEKKEQPANVLTLSVKEYDISESHASLQHIPVEVEKVAKEHARLFQLRSRLSDQRYELGKSNSPDVVKKRQVLTQSIHEISERTEQLFEAHSAYMTNRVLPDLKKLNLAANPDIVMENINRLAEEPSAEEPQAPATTISDLKKRRTSLLSMNRRDRLILNYGQPKQLKRKNPLPDGPEREKIEQRVLARQAEIEAIEAEVKKLKK